MFLFEMFVDVAIWNNILLGPKISTLMHFVKETRLKRFSFQAIGRGYIMIQQYGVLLILN